MKYFALLVLLIQPLYSDVFISRIATGGGGGPTLPLTPTSGETTVTTGPTVTLPTGILANDIIYVVFTTNNHNSTNTTYPTWTEAVPEIDGAGVSSSIYYSRASGGETTFTFTNLFDTSELGTYTAFVVRGAITTGNPIEANINETSGSGTAKDVAVTSLSANAAIIGIIGFPNSSAAAYTTTYDASPDAITEHVGSNTTPTGFVDAGNHQNTIGFFINGAPDSGNIGLDLGTAAAACEFALAITKAP